MLLFVTDSRYDRIEVILSLPFLQYRTKTPSVVNPSYWSSNIIHFLCTRLRLVKHTHTRLQFDYLFLFCQINTIFFSKLTIPHQIDRLSVQGKAFIFSWFQIPLHYTSIINFPKKIKLCRT